MVGSLKEVKFSNSVCETAFTATRESHLFVPIEDLLNLNRIHMLFRPLIKQADQETLWRVTLACNTIHDLISSNYTALTPTLPDEGDELSRV